MNETVKLFLENPGGTIVFFGCLSVFIWVLHKYVPNPLSKLQALLTVIADEFSPKSKNNWVERINMLSIIFFALIFILLLVIKSGGTFFNEVFNIDKKEEYDSLTLLSLIFLFLVVVYSPLLIIFSNKDRAVKVQGEKLLNKQT